MVRDWGTPKKRQIQAAAVAEDTIEQAAKIEVSEETVEDQDRPVDSGTESDEEPPVLLDEEAGSEVPDTADSLFETELPPEEQVEESDSEEDEEEMSELELFFAGP